MTIRLDNYAGAEDRLIRVLTVEPNSPAAIAGLIPEKDFLLGTTHQTLDSVDRLAVSVLRDHIDEIVEMYVVFPSTMVIPYSNSHALSVMSTIRIPIRCEWRR